MADFKSRLIFQAIDRISPTIERLDGRFARFTTRATQGLKLLGVGLGIREFQSFVLGAAAARDELAKLSDRLEISAQRLAAYQFIAERTGVSFNLFERGLQRTLELLGDAQRGDTTAIDLFNELNIAITDLARLDPASAFEEIGNAIASIEDPILRDAIAAEVFGSRATALLQTFRGGREGIAQLNAELDNFRPQAGEAAGVSATFADAVTNLNTSFKGLVDQMSVAVLPIFTAVVDKFTEALELSKQLYAAFAGGLLTALGAVVRLIDRDLGQGLIDLGEVRFDNSFEFLGGRGRSNVENFSGTLIKARDDAEALNEQFREVGKTLEQIQTDRLSIAGQLLSQLRADEADRLASIGNPGQGRVIRSAQEFAISAIGVGQKVQKVESPQLVAIQRQLEAIERAVLLERAQVALAG